jgi:hypothetical protein
MTICRLMSKGTATAEANPYGMTSEKNNGNSKGAAEGGCPV